MGARGVQQLRETAIELQMAPVRSSVHIPVATLWAHFQGGDVNKGLAELETPLFLPSCAPGVTAVASIELDAGWSELRALLIDAKRGAQRWAISKGAEAYR
jgi:hypothetical protein